MSVGQREGQREDMRERYKVATSLRFQIYYHVYNSYKGAPYLGLYGTRFYYQALDLISANLTQHGYPDLDLALVNTLPEAVELKNSTVRGEELIKLTQVVAQEVEQVMIELIQTDLQPPSLETISAWTFLPEGHEFYLPFNFNVSALGLTGWPVYMSYKTPQDDDELYRHHNLVEQIGFNFYSSPTLAQLAHEGYSVREEGIIYYVYPHLWCLKNSQYGTVYLTSNLELGSGIKDT